MNNDLQTLSKLFTEKLFRIPDYQRGYAWTEPQLLDFWSDLNQIPEDGTHYTGVLTLESVPLAAQERWSGDRWIIESKGFDPFYIVDGQQRLTTSIVLIQCICESLINDDDYLNYTTRREIQKKFIFDTKDGGVSRSYIFGYERDNPSYEYLKTEIFREISATDRKEETVYTNNLSFAKTFFKDRIAPLERVDIEKIYLKVTQKLLFNTFTISDDVDVCVAFETMNNRGKPLSHLELLKNRLIYLSTKLEVDRSESDALRRTINDSWKTIYHNLGRNKERPLDDDFFLRCHHFLRYIEPVASGAPPERAVKERRLVHAIEAQDYKALLNEIFTFASILEQRGLDPDADRKALGRINDYSISLQESVKKWFNLFNPAPTNDKNNPDFWLQRLLRLNSEALFPLLLSIMIKVNDPLLRSNAFAEIERLIFIQRLAGISRWDTATPELLSEAIRLYNDETDISNLISLARSQADLITNTDDGRKRMRDALRSRNFYFWRPIQYLLYEYNYDLQMRSKTEREKIVWEKFAESEADYRSIEHIYPQSARFQYWRDNFGGLKPAQRDLLKNVVGNLLPLSKPKNASLSNLPYTVKVAGRTHGVGYAYGSYSENEVAVLYSDWTPQAILDRSLKILDFIEERWGLSLGKDAEKIEILGLNFVTPLGRLTGRVHGVSDASPKSSARKPPRGR